MIRCTAFWIGLLLALSAGAAPVRIVDDAGQVLEFGHPPQRIVSLSPHLTELLFAVGAGEQVIGVDSASDFPPAARALPRVGDYSRVNTERILALRPDLVVVWVGGNRAMDIHALTRMGFPVLHTQATRLDDVTRLLRLLGQASGHAGEAEIAARDFSARLAAMQVHPRRIPPLAVFYEVWDRPLMTVGGTHWISDALALCGARNIFADLDALSPVVSLEAVLRRSPAVIVSGSDAPDMRQTWQRFARLPAVRDQAFVRVDADRLHRLTPRLVEGVAELCAAIRPWLEPE